MRSRFLFLAIAQILLGALSVTSLGAQQQPLPRIVHAWAPLYPLFGPESGTVALHLTTDGNRVIRIGELSAPNRVLNAAEDSVRTWEFELHEPMSFDVKFNYRMLPSSCKCKTCGRAVTDSVVLRLPASVEVTGVQLCDFAVDHGWDERRRPGLFHLPSTIGRGFLAFFSKLSGSSTAKVQSSQ